MDFNHRRSSRGMRAELCRRGFTLIELLIAIGMVAILLAILVPYLIKVREAAHRTDCASHLRQIGVAFSQYARDNGNHSPLPEVTYDSVHKPMGYVAFTGPDGGNPFAAGSGVQSNDVTASLWLLVRSGYVKDLSVFVCPSTWDEPDHLTGPSALQQRGNFRQSFNLSYSYASPFTNAYGWSFSSDRLPAEFVVIADKNPGFASRGTQVLGPARDAPPFELAQGNSRNHQRAGQNVLHPAGDVSFETTPYCGVARDNIYTAVAPARLQAEHPALDAPGYIGNSIGPAYEYDSYLVPTASEGPK